MISEIMFAARSASFWKTCTPTSEAFVRIINSHLVSKRVNAINSTSTPDRRGLVNETAFEAFAQRHIDDVSLTQAGKRISDRAIQKAFRTANKFISRTDSYSSLNVDPLSVKEVEEVQSLVANLERRFWNFLVDESLYLRPQFKGCGVLSSCVGDLRTSDCLFEIKAGGRLFRSVDIRQILIYSALCYSDTGFIFKNIELFNPRSGLAFTCELDFLCFEISGKSTSQLLFDIIAYASDQGSSG